MTYELYCYKSDQFHPELSEAHKLINDEYPTKINQISTYNNRTFKVLMALRQFNPTLDSCYMDGYNKLIKSKKTKGHQIILNTPIGEPSTQLLIAGTYVLISVPFLYSASKAKQAFEEINEYIRIIRLTVNYFVYDPQEEKVFDPWTQSFDNLSMYLEMSGIAAQQKLENEKLRSWWKFW
jgi:hypothetical protein